MEGIGLRSMCDGGRDGGKGAEGVIERAAGGDAALARKCCVC